MSQHPRMPDMVGGRMPVIDVSAVLRGKPRALEATAAEVRYANEEVGFYLLAGHGISDDLIADTYEAAASFHAQPMEAKLAPEGQHRQCRIHADQGQHHQNQHGQRQYEA
jgi:isopenicillin N synthase-like dioxygenase